MSVTPLELNHSLHRVHLPFFRLTLRGFPSPFDFMFLHVLGSSTCGISGIDPTVRNKSTILFPILPYFSSTLEEENTKSLYKYHLEVLDHSFLYNKHYTVQSMSFLFFLFVPLKTSYLLVLSYFMTKRKPLRLLRYPYLVCNVSSSPLPTPSEYFPMHKS